MLYGCYRNVVKRRTGTRVASCLIAFPHVFCQQVVVEETLRERGESFDCGIMTLRLDSERIGKLSCRGAGRYTNGFRRIQDRSLLNGNAILDLAITVVES